ncbi:MAG: response regulator [Prevotella sp.]|nr:response regulator [Prevotella sp.]
MSSRNGLFNNTISCFLQDSIGFVWMGSAKGLLRYDGNNIFIYRSENGNNTIPLDERILNITEDKRGYLWIYTADECICCFDMKKECFVDFTGNSIYSEPYNQIFIDSKQNVWLYSTFQNGCLRIQIDDDKFTTRKYDAEHHTLYNNKVTFLKEDKNGTIWIGTQGGVTMVDGSDIHLLNGNHNFIKIYFYKDNVFFVGRDGVVGQLAKDNTIANVFTIPSPDNEYISTSVQRDSICHIFTNNHTFTFNFDDSSVKVETEITIPYPRTFTDNNGDYWVYNGTGNVWYIPHLSMQPMKCFQFMEGEMLNFIDQEKYYVIQDRRGWKWIVTYGNGLFVYNPKTDKLTHYLSDQKRSIIDSDFLLAVMEDHDGDIWVGTESAGLSHLSIFSDGISKIDFDYSSSINSQNRIQFITRSKENQYWISNNSGDLFMYDSELKQCLKREKYPIKITAVQYDAEHILYKGSFGNGILIGDKWYQEENISNKLTKLMFQNFQPPIKRDSDGLNSNYFSTLYKDAKGRIWGGTWGNGLLLISKEQGKYQFKTFLGKNEREPKRIQALIEDRKGRMWVATTNGLYIFYADSLLQNSKNYAFFSKKNCLLSDNDISALYEDHSCNMWLGTSGCGVSLCKYIEKDHRLEMIHYDTSNGLSSNEIMAFIEDKSRRLWISTSNGLTCYTPQNQSFNKLYITTMTKEDMYTKAVCSGPKGTLLFGTNDGIISIDPDKKSMQRTSNKACFTSLWINNIQVTPNGPDGILSEALHFYDKIELAYNQNVFTVHFSDFDYLKPGQSHYSYKLQNYDNSWSVPTEIGQATYKNVPPGEYTLRVRACNSSGTWCDEESSLKIVVRPPFWKATWAYCCYLVLIMIVCYIAFTIIRKFDLLRQRIQTEETITDFKLRFFTNITHEFRTPLTLIKGSLERMEKIESMPEEASSPLSVIYKNSDRLMRLIEQLLMFRKVQFKKLKLSLEETDVIAFCKESFSMYEELAMSKRIIYCFIPFDSHYTMYIDRNYVDKIINNLLSNAFKYTPEGGEIKLSISRDEPHGSIIIKVVDTGIGIPVEKRNELFKRYAQINTTNNSFGIGLNLTYELVRAHNGEIHYAPNGGQGSIFIVSLPVSTECYAVDEFSASLKAIDNQKDMKLFDAIEKGSFAVPFNDIKLLVIDDDEDIKEYVKDVMGKYFIVETAPDVVTGLNIVKNNQPDLILCDVLMPEINGYEFVRKMKEDKSLNHIPIILLTSLSDDSDRIKAYECGADDYITKPFSVSLLLTRIINIINQRIELQEKFGKEKISIAQKALLTNDQDKKFVDRMNTIVDNSLSNADFDIDAFAAMMGYKRTVFYQKTSSILGITPNDFLREARLKKAMELLQDDRTNVSEVAFKVGFADPSYFSRCFKAYYGMSPSQLKKQK